MAIAAAAGGVIAATLLTAPPIAPSAIESEGDATIGLVQTELTDSRRVTLAVTAGTPRQLVAGDSGVLTDLDCTPGSSWESGTAPIGINGSPRALLRTETPLWRDLTGSERGEDVEAVQQALVDAGYSTPTTGVYDSGTRAAWGRLLKSLGIVSTDGALHLTDLIPLPSTAVTIGTCPLEAGASVSPGTAIAQLHAGLAGVAISPLPSGLLPGARSLTVDTVTVAVPESGHVTDSAALDQLTGEPSIAAVVAGTAKDAGGTLVLTDPLVVYEVPPSTLTSITGARACLVTDGAGRSVDIITSALGATAVRFTDDRPAPKRVELRPDPGVPCD